MYNRITAYYNNYSKTRHPSGLISSNNIDPRQSCSIKPEQARCVKLVAATSTELAQQAFLSQFAQELAQQAFLGQFAQTFLKLLRILDY